MNCWVYKHRTVEATETNLTQTSHDRLCPVILEHSLPHGPQLGNPRRPDWAEQTRRLLCTLRRFPICSPCAASLLPTFLPKPGFVLRKNPCSLLSALVFLLLHTERAPDKGSFSKERFIRAQAFKGSAHHRGGHSTAGQFTSWWSESRDRKEAVVTSNTPSSAVCFLPHLPMFLELLKIVPAAGGQGGAHCPDITSQDEGCEWCLPTSLGPL